MPTTTMNFVRVTPSCDSCGKDLTGVDFLNVLEVHCCMSVHCLSRTYVQHVARLEPRERDYLGQQLSRLQRARMMLHQHTMAF